MIIVEGCDATGKTTLIAQIQEQLRIPSIRSGMRSPPLQRMMEYHFALQNFPIPLILDRHPAISDYVYAHCLRGGQTESTLKFAKECRGDNFLIYAMPPLDHVLENISNNPQMEGVEDCTAHIYQSYQRMAQYTGYDLIYDYTQPDEINRTINSIRTHLHLRERGAAQLLAMIG